MNESTVICDNQRSLVQRVVNRFPRWQHHRTKYHKSQISQIDSIIGWT